jgi:hypothetical protein
MAGVSVVRWLGAGAFALACVAAGPSGAAPASEHARVLVVGDDSDQDSIPRGNPASAACSPR